MKSVLNNPWLVLGLSFLIINIPLWIFPINFFPGEIVYQSGLAENKVEAPLSLSYFIGLGYENEDMTGIKSFYLTTKGLILAFCICFGMPVILALRSFSRKK